MPCWSRRRAAPACTVTVATCSSWIPFAVAVTLRAPAAVELSRPEATPFASVGALGWVSVLPLPSTASATATPAIGLPN